MLAGMRTRVCTFKSMCECTRVYVCECVCTSRHVGEYTHTQAHTCKHKNRCAYLHGQSCAHVSCVHTCTHMNTLAPLWV